jgi:hypothetical protein
MLVVVLIISMPFRELLIAFSDLWFQIELGKGKVSNCSIQNDFRELDISRDSRSEIAKGFSNRYISIEYNKKKSSPATQCQSKIFRLLLEEIYDNVVYISLVESVQKHWTCKSKTSRKPNERVGNNTNFGEYYSQGARNQESVRDKVGNE